MADTRERDTREPATGDTRGNVPRNLPSGEPNARAGLEREVGDLDDADAVDDDGALPGRVGGGLAGG